MPTPSISLKIIRVDDSLLRENIVRMSAATGRTVKEETRTAFKGMLRDAMNYTPPGSQGVTGAAAKRAGEAAIGRDLSRMGFVPVQIKGYRTITQAFGRPIRPVRVETHENPRFADVEAIHRDRLQNKHGGIVTRGGKQPWYVDRGKYRALRQRLINEVGLLASGWAKAALQLGVNVPAWIARHIGANRGTEVLLQETDNRLSMRVVNHFPDTAGKEADQVERLIDFIKRAAIGRLKRQLPYILRSKLRAAHR